jgi:hypothetical protein
MGEARADREPIDGRKGKIMTPRGTSNAFHTGASHFISLRSPFATPGGWLVTKLQRALWISADFRLMSLRKKCFPATEIILALTLACSGLHAQASQVQTFPLSGTQDLDARNVKVESTPQPTPVPARVEKIEPPDDKLPLEDQRFRLWAQSHGKVAASGTKTEVESVQQLRAAHERGGATNRLS